MATGQRDNTPAQAEQERSHVGTLRGLIPDVVWMSCADNTVHLDVPEADFRVRFDAAPGGPTVLRIYAVFRENKPAGGTWWSSWQIEVDAPPDATRVGAALATEIRRSRRRFHRILADTVALTA